MKEVEAVKKKAGSSFFIKFAKYSLDNQFDGTVRYLKLYLFCVWEFKVIQLWAKNLNKW